MYRLTFLFFLLVAALTSHGQSVISGVVMRLLGGVPFGDGNSCCFPFVAENVLPCITLMGNER